MSLDAGAQAGIIGVGVAVLIGSGTGVVKAASFRGDLHNKWARRVQFAVAALDERNLRELEQLRDEIDDVLPADFDPAFDPSEAIVDPAPLARRAGQSMRYYRARTRMERDLARLGWVGPVAIGGFGALAVATATLTIYYVQLLDWPALRVSGLVLLAACALVLVLTLGLYVVLHHRLTSAEMLAGTSGETDKEAPQ